MKEQGVIYILTNPSFPEYVKIGYADNVEKRLKELNRSECIPFAFRLYAYYQVDTRLSDLKIHEMIDKLNPNLRSIDFIEGKKRVREFYTMSAEEAYSLLESIATINGLEKYLHKVKPTDKELDEDKEANIVRLDAFRFSMCNLKEGDELEFINDRTKKCFVVSEKKVSFEGEEYSLTGLAKILLGKTYSLVGTHYFSYNGIILNDLREQITEDNIKNGK